MSETIGTTSIAGPGDNWLGARYRFHDQTKNTPALGLSYTIKLPTASAAKGLGSGYVDHAFMLLASKDVRQYHFDFNAMDTLAGAAGGFDNSSVLSLACWRPLTKRLSAVTESHGGSQPDGSRYAAVLMGTSYSVNPKFVLDAAFESAVTSGAPRKRLLIGATYAIGNLSSRVRPRASATAVENQSSKPTLAPEAGNDPSGKQN